jgi:AraC-like DNA-binding protein
LSGSYVEVGDTGRHRVGPGDVLLHRPYESHLDRFERRGAEVLIVPIAWDGFACASGRLTDLDAIVRLLESNTGTAEETIFRQLQAKTAMMSDWPDHLASALHDDPALSIGEWASGHGLSLGSVSRAFGQIYGVSPATYRLLQRTHRAIRAILRTDTPLAAIAYSCGFADQAHMTRSVRRITALSPQALRALWRGHLRSVDPGCPVS